MIYTMDTRIRFHEVGPDQKLSVTGLIDLLQDCGNFHGEDTGATLDYQYEVGQTWAVTSWNLIIDEWPKLGDRVITSTWSYKARHFLAYRNFTVKSPEGKCYVKADSQWIMLNTKDYTPVEIRQEIMDMYTTEPDAKLPDKFSGRVIRMPEGGEYLEKFEAAEYMLDANKHINNGQFVRLAAAYIPADLRFNRFSAEYVAQGHLGDMITPYRVKTDNGWRVALLQEDGKPYFKAEWEMKDNDQTG